MSIFAYIQNALVQHITDVRAMVLGVPVARRRRKKTPVNWLPPQDRGFLNTLKDMGIIAKIYPNGECSLYFERMLKKKAFPCTQKRTDRQYRHYLDFKEKFGHSAALAAQNAARRGDAPLGLVTVPISTKNAASPVATKGLTRLGARTLRQGAFLIEQSAGKDQVTFGTATLPAVTDEELALIEMDWSNIIDRFVKRLRYHLTKKNLPSEVIHVTEIQPKRSLNEGREIPHIHFVFQGRKRRGAWAITPKQITKFWCRAIGLKSLTLRMYGSSCQLARVKYSVARYLSKYIAKSHSKTEDATSQPTLRTLSIKQWWGCTDSLRKRIHRSTSVLGGTDAEQLWRSHEQDISSVWEYLGAIKSTYRERDIIFCRFGRLTKGARQKYLRPDLGERWERVHQLEKLVKGLTEHEITGILPTIDSSRHNGVKLQ